MLYVAPQGLTGKTALEDKINGFANGAGSVRTGLTIIMMMFFAALALDLTVPAVILLGALALDWASVQFKRMTHQEGRTA